MPRWRTSLHLRLGNTSPVRSPRIVRIRLASLASLLAVAVILFAVLWRTWAVLQWTFLGDDWAYVSDAARIPFLSFVTSAYHGHLQPGQFALVWTVTRLAPLNYAVAVAPLLIATLVGGVLMWRLLRDLFGDRPANLVPLTILMLCPLSLPPALWWAASLQTIPLQVFIVGTLFAVLRYIRVPSTGRLAVVGVAYTGAVLFWEKALLILPLVVLFVLLFLGEGSGRARLRSISVRRWQLWALLAVITAGYVGWYLAAANWPLTGYPTLSQLERLAKTTVGSTVIPTYLGGPWSASARGPVVLFELTGLPRMITWVVAVAIVAVALLVRRQAWRAWVLPIVYVGMCVALLGFSRLTLIGPVIGLGARYVADSVSVLAIAIALAFMVPRERQSDPAWTARYRVGSTKLASWALAVGVVLVYSISALITSYRMAGLANQYSPKAWFATVKTELASHPTASVFDRYLPSSAIRAALFPESAKASRALAPIAPHVRWNAPAEKPLIFDDAGKLQPVEVASVASSKPGPVSRCGYLVSRLPVVVSLERHLFAWSWGVRLAYFTNRNGNGFVTIDGDRQAVRFLQGLHGLTLIHYGTAAVVTLESHGSPVCVTNIRVGNIKPMPSG